MGLERRRIGTKVYNLLVVGRNPCTPTSDVTLSRKTVENLMTRGPPSCEMYEAKHLGTAAFFSGTLVPSTAALNHLRWHTDSSAPVAEVHRRR